jgi:hypothetical protein
MRIIVYLETENPRYAEIVAEFASDYLYSICLPALEAYAKSEGYILTESVREDEFMNDEEMEE